MKKTFNRTISWLLSVTMLFGIFFIGDITEIKANASGIDNITARADYLYNLTWTAQKNVNGWKNRDSSKFYQGQTYHIPYGQPVDSGKYVYWGVSIAEYVSSTQNASSVFYTTRSSYQGAESTYYAMDCSAFTSYCWGLSNRTTTSAWSNLSVTNYGKCTSANVGKIQQGDTLCLAGSHVVLVSRVNSNGTYEITEETPPQLTRNTYNASTLVSKYSNYTIYRYNKRDSVPAPPNAILPTTINNQNYAIPATVNASHKIYTYNEYGNQESGRWIDQGDKCYIDAVYVNSYVHVQYPTNGSSEPNRWTYAKLDDFTDVLPIIKQKPTGYNIKVSSANIYDCESLGITITPYEDNFTNIRIYLVYPDGKVVSKDFGTTKSMTVNPTKLGVWKIYARIDNAYGSYEGSTSNGCVSVNVSRPNMGSKVDLGSDFYAYIINKDSGNALTNDNDNVSSKTLQSSTNQRWHFKKQSDGSYQIESVSGNGKCLDAYSGKGRSKDNVQVYKKDNEPVQQWWIYSAGSEVYYLMPTCSGSAVLDVDGGSSNSGANVQIWAYNQSAAQKFEIRKIGSADISLSSSSVSLDLCGTNTSTVNITANGNLPSSYHFSANRDTSAMDTTWGGWSGSTSPITIKGKKTGTYDLKISLVDGNTNQTVTTKTITVNISCSHSFGAWTTTKQAACTAEGTSSRTCSHCGKAETKTIPKTDHQYSSSVTQPTCSSQGYTTYTCTKCQHSYVADYKPATGVHTFGSWTTTKQATCTAEGTSSRTCSHCGKVETKTIPKTDHQYLGSVRQPTCSSQGYTTYTCMKCQHSYVADYKPATGQHTFNAGSQTITKEPTCTEEGIQTQKCTVCGKEFTNSIPAKGHLYVSTVVKPTCTEKGYTVHSCFNGCGSSYKDSYTAALGHNFGSWTTTKQPTCTSEGTKTRNCSRCNKSETQTVPKLDHDYKTTVIAPTTTSQGYTLHKCSKCGNEYKDNYKDKLTQVDASSPQIVAEKVSGSAGSIINYKISIKNNPGIVGIRFNVSYDTSVLTLQETKGGIFKDTTFGSLASPLSVVWGDSIHEDNKTNGTVVELVFKVKDTAKSGSYPVKITYDSDDIFNSNLENVNFTVVNGSVNVVDHIPGDVNGDGNVNMKDYAVLQRYLNNWNVTIVKNAADVNADGSVNMKDYALLQRYLNGWNIQLK